MKITCTRHHDFSMGHRVVGHEGKCKFLHGHNYRIHFTIQADELDFVGRVIDFSCIKHRLCEWLENNWDHRLILWHQDPYAKKIALIDPSIEIVEFNPTAENMAKYLIDTVGPKVLIDTKVKLIKVTVEETRKCSATAEFYDV